MKTAIVYFSRIGENWVDGKIVNLDKGNTEIIASYIQEATKGDLFPLVMKEPYSDNYEVCVRQAQNDQFGKIDRELVFYPDMKDYDTIYLGYPIYWEDLPSPVITFLKHTDLKGKIIYPFSTHEGSGLGASVSHIRDLANGAIVKDALPFPGSLVLRGRNRIKNWVEPHLKLYVKRPV